MGAINHHSSVAGRNLRHHARVPSKLKEESFHQNDLEVKNRKSKARFWGTFTLKNNEIEELIIKA